MGFAQPMTREQPWLLAYRNPLSERFGPEFFQGIPRAPGVYFMRGDDGYLLYVGKAKDLRERVSSYRRAKPGDVGRKVIRMVNLVRSIHWEECVSEEAALLRENEVLRGARPPFNVVNKNPELYPFIALAVLGSTLRLRRTTQPRPEPGPDELFFGTFKGHGTVQRGYSALLRLLWASHRESSSDLFSGRVLEYPGPLTRFRPPDRFEVALRPSLGEEGWKLWTQAVARFLRGTSNRLLPMLSEEVLKLEGLPQFQYGMIQTDLEALVEFYERGPQRNRKLRRFHDLSEPLIAQEQIDDLLVTFRSRHDTPKR